MEKIDDWVPLRRAGLVARRQIDERVSALGFANLVAPEGSRLTSLMTD